MSAEKSTVVIAGCGDLGTETGLRFARLGHPVVGLRRSAALLPPEIAGVSIDLRREVPVIPGDTATVIVALAAGERSAEAYRATYLDGLRNLLDGIDRVGVNPRVILVSSTAVYSVDDGSVVDESTPALAATPTAGILLETERLLHNRVPEGIVFRLGGIYGPGRERLITQVRSGEARLPLGPSHTNRIHRDDAAAALVHLAVGVSDPAPLYLGVDDEPAELAEVLTYLAAQLGVAVPAAAGPAGSAAGTAGQGAAGPGAAGPGAAGPAGSAAGVAATEGTARAAADNAAAAPEGAARAEAESIGGEPERAARDGSDRADRATSAGAALGSESPARPGDKRCNNGLLRSTGFAFAYPTFREGYRALLTS